MSWCFITVVVILTKIEMTKKGVGHCCNKPDRVFGSTVEGLWNLGLEKSLAVESSMSCSVGALRIKSVAIQKIEAWLVKF